MCQYWLVSSSFTQFTGTDIRVCASRLSDVKVSLRIIWQPNFTGSFGLFRPTFITVSVERLLCKFSMHLLIAYNGSNDAGNPLVKRRCLQHFVWSKICRSWQTSWKKFEEFRDVGLLNQRQNTEHTRSLNHKNACDLKQPATAALMQPER